MAIGLIFAFVIGSLLLLLGAIWLPAYVVSALVPFKSKHPLARKPPITSFDDSCPRCNNRINLGAKRCVSCGYVLDAVWKQHIITTEKIYTNEIADQLAAANEELRHDEE